MGVIYKTFGENSGAGGSGTPIPTTFSDDFNRADTTQGIGTNYLYPYFTYNAAASGNPRNRILGNALVWGNNTITSQVSGLQCIPWTTANSLVNGQPQFAQITFVATTDANSADFLCLMHSGSGDLNDFKMYFLGLQAANQARVLRVADNGGGVLVSTSLGFAAMAVGDVLRFEVRPSAASNRVAVIVNGAIALNVVDNGADRPTPTIGGFPGLACFNVSNGVAVTLDDFSCGLGCTFI